MALKCDAVFEGGGVKGIGLVGAYSAVQKAGYELENLAGTSAGAIIASLIAVGYTADEIEGELQELNYNRFKDANCLDKLAAFFDFGIYRGDYFKKWLERLLKAKGRTVFGDIRTRYIQDKYKYKFQAIVTDISNRRMVVIPNDLRNYGYDPDRFSISEAVRMSMSIPIFFKPYRLKDSRGKVHLMVDGGVLSNYPVWLLDDGTSSPPWPTFGFKLTSDPSVTDPYPTYRRINNLLDYTHSLIGTMIDGHDNFHVSVAKGDYARTIFIPTKVTLDGVTKSIKTTDFNITPEESRALFKNGLLAGKAFLRKWNFESWKKRYREGLGIVNQWL